MDNIAEWYRFTVLLWNVINELTIDGFSVQVWVHIKLLFVNSWRVVWNRNRFLAFPLKNLNRVVVVRRWSSRIATALLSKSLGSRCYWTCWSGVTVCWNNLRWGEFKCLCVWNMEVKSSQHWTAILKVKFNHNTPLSGVVAQIPIHCRTGRAVSFSRVSQQPRWP